MSLTRDKLNQAVGFVRDAGLNVWLTFVRETAEGSDPVLPLLINGGMTWQSAFLVSSTGRKVAVVGNYDADPLLASEDWDEVVPYVQGIRAPLLEALESMVGPGGTIGINFSPDDVKADGLTYGMKLLLDDYLSGTRFADSLVSAAAVCSRLRGIKTGEELRRMKLAIAETDRLFAEVPYFAKVGVSERAVYQEIQRRMDERGLGYSWDRHGDPIVNSGPDSMIGHGIPSESVQISEGHIFHIDLGVISEGYSSDIQRCWFVGDSVPDDVVRAAEAVNAAISAGASVLRAGVEGWQVDEAARRTLVEHGYPEYLHAFGHQVGRAAHDGGAVLGPKWERYGRTPVIPIEAGEVYTLELGITVPGRGYLGLEEMAVVTPDGCEFLTERQMEIPLLPC